MKKIEINKIDVNGKKQGYWDELFIDNIKSKGNYINGKKDGLWVFYDNKNKITSIQSFKNGKSDGICEGYYNNGNINSRFMCENGKIIKYEGYYKDGELAETY